MAAPLLITSPQNPAVKQTRALWQKKARDEAGLFVCEGEHMVQEAARYAGQDVVSVFVSQEKLDAYQPLLERLGGQTRVFAAPERVMEQLTQVKAPQGIVAVVRKPKPATLEQLGDRVLLLDNVQDPGNVGTMMRTLDAAGFTGMITTKGCADLYGDKALRSTMGSVFRVPLVETEDATATLEELSARGIETIAAALDGEPFYERKSQRERICLVIGNEGAGIREDVKAACGKVYRLPMVGQAESLNAAVAAAVMMYDLVNR